MSEMVNDFERAFVAISFLAGRRGDELLAGISTPGPRARSLAERLSASDRAARAAVLAPELARLVQSLDRRRLR